MTKESTSFGLEPEQVQHLLKIGEDAKDSDRPMKRNESKREILRRQLAVPLPLEKSQIDMLPAALSQLCRTLGLLAGESINSLVQDPTTDISLILRIKQYSRELSATCESEDDREVATALYYAAIAHALCFHDSKISQFSYGKLEKAFGRLAKERWVSSEFRVVFKKARRICREKAKP